jgi:hypothetical protein
MELFHYADGGRIIDATATIPAGSATELVGSWRRTPIEPIELLPQTEYIIRGNLSEDLFFSVFRYREFPIDHRFVSPRVCSEITGDGAQCILVPSMIAGPMVFVEPDPLLHGDFSRNGRLDAPDIDILASQILSGNQDAQYDLNQDFAVDQLDHHHWVQNVRRTWFGDVNMKGAFDSNDLVLVFEAGQYEDALAQNSSWETDDCTRVISYGKHPTNEDDAISTNRYLESAVERTKCFS